MGRYTQLTMTYYLKAATPPEVLAVHKYLLGDDGGFPDPFPGPLPEHPLFQCDRWDSIGRGGGEYPGPFRAFTPAFREGWEVGFSCSFKDYDDEIRHWLDWIGPMGGDLPAGDRVVRQRRHRVGVDHLGHARPRRETGRVTRQHPT